MFHAVGYQLFDFLENLAEMVLWTEDVGCLPFSCIVPRYRLRCSDFVHVFPTLLDQEQRSPRYNSISTDRVMNLHMNRMKFVPLDHFHKRIFERYIGSGYKYFQSFQERHIHPKYQYGFIVPNPPCEHT